MTRHSPPQTWGRCCGLSNSCWVGPSKDINSKHTNTPLETDYKPLKESSAFTTQDSAVLTASKSAETSQQRFYCNRAAINPTFSLMHNIQ